MASQAALFSERLLKPSQRNFLLYRRVLKFLADHNPRDDLCTEARKVRAEFEEHRHEKNQKNIDFLIDRAYFWLNQYRHPEPYTIPNHEGGSSYLRNQPIFPETIKNHSILTERPEEYLRRTP